jgi:hypothetical protein
MNEYQLTSGHVFSPHIAYLSHTYWKSKLDDEALLEIYMSDHRSFEVTYQRQDTMMMKPID